MSYNAELVWPKGEVRSRRRLSGPPQVFFHEIVGHIQGPETKRSFQPNSVLAGFDDFAYLPAGNFLRSNEFPLCTNLALVSREEVAATWTVEDWREAIADRLVVLADRALKRPYDGMGQEWSPVYLRFASLALLLPSQKAAQAISRFHRLIRYRFPYLPVDAMLNANAPSLNEDQLDAFGILEDEELLYLAWIGRFARSPHVRKSCLERFAERLPFTETPQSLIRALRKASDAKLIETPRALNSYFPEDRGAERSEFLQLSRAREKWVTRSILLHSILAILFVLMSWRRLPSRLRALIVLLSLLLTLALLALRIDLNGLILNPPAFALGLLLLASVLNLRSKRPSVLATLILAAAFLLAFFGGPSLAIAQGLAILGALILAAQIVPALGKLSQEKPTL